MSDLADLLLLIELLECIWTSPVCRVRSEKM